MRASEIRWPEDDPRTGRILRRMLVHGQGNEGTMAVLEGPQRVGKSGLMLHWSELLVEDFNEAVTWRGFRDASWHRYPGDHDRIRLLLHDRLDIDFLRAQHDEALTEWDPTERYDIVRFSDAKDLLRKRDYGVFNVVYAQEQRTVPDDDGRLETRRTGFWRHYMELLRRKDVKKPDALMLDDFMDLYPAIQRGSDHEAVEQIQEELAQFSKTRNSLYGAVHASSDAHYMLLNKMQGTIWMPGSSPQGSGSSVPASTVHHRAEKVMGSHVRCIIEHYNEYCEFEFGDTPAPFELVVETSPRSAFDREDTLTPTTTIRGVPIALLRSIARGDTNPHALSRDPDLPSDNTIRRALDDYRINHPDDYEEHKRLENAQGDASPQEAGGTASMDGAAADDNAPATP